MPVSDRRPLGGVSQFLSQFGFWAEPLARKPLILQMRRDVRVVEGARLESVCRGNSTEGSNPSLSAKFLGKIEVHPVPCGHRALSFRQRQGVVPNVAARGLADSAAAWPEASRCRVLPRARRRPQCPRRGTESE